MIQNETDRLEALRQYAILDTDPEQDFDDLTLLASQVCETPIALISLVDGNRQWFKSRFGLQLLETARGASFCTHAIEQPDIFVVENAATDERFRNNPMVRGEPFIRFYAGATLFSREGAAVGTLCVLDRRVRSLAEDQRKALDALRRQAEAQLELRRSVMELRRAMRERDDAMQDHARSEARNRAVVDNMLEGLIVIDEHLRIVQYNSALAGIFGYDREELIGRRAAVLMPDHPEYQDARQLGDMFRQSLGRVTEREGRRRTGEIFPLQLQLYEVGTPDGKLMAGHVRDLSQEREGDRLKKWFVASISHEVRTPLTAIRGALGLLSLGTTGALPPEAQELVNVADRNAARLNDIVNNLLDFERLQNGLLSIAREAFSIDDAISRCCESAGDLAAQAGIRIVCTPAGLQVYADEARIVQVLINLVSNAVKFSPRGTDIEILGVRRGRQVEVRVYDRGRGIPIELREIVFEPFRQSEESDTRSRGGSGLGLAICRAIVRQHGGDIGVIDRVGGGSIFWFTLPMPESAPAPNAGE